jgi:hypothetical protein
MDAEPRAGEHAHTTDRFVDIAAVVLISLTALLSAWCGFQTSRWGTLQSRDYNEASAHRLEASVLSGRANTLENVDITLFLQYTIAKDEGHADVAGFIERRFRDEFRPAFNAWLAANRDPHHPGPSSPFVMPEYQLAANAQAAVLDRQASDLFSSAVNAGELADTFVRLTVLFAGVSFLAGISTKFRYPGHLIVVACGFVILIYSCIRLAGMKDL